MAESKAPIPVDEGVEVPEAATFYVDNKIYEGFKNLRLSRNLTALTGSFEITLVDKWRVDQEDFALKPGQEISCRLGDTPLYKGYIDRFSISLTESSRNLTISGRDLTGDLVDCSILGNNEFNNMKLEAIAKELVKPFGIGVIVFADTGKPFQKFTVNQGETVFEALERLAKQRELLLTSSPVGNLVFEKKGVVRASTELIEGINIKSAAVTFDNSERFSEYHVKGQAPGLIGTNNDNTKAKGLAKDNGIERYRPTLVLADNAADADGAQQRAAWEASFRAAKGMQVNVLTVGWTQKGGDLWATNQTVHLECRSLGIKQDLLVQSVRFEQGSRGKLTELELIRPDAFEFKTEIKKEDDPLDLLGWDS
jgi:prophage tail gpP-like protein